MSATMNGDDMAPRGSNAARTYRVRELQDVLNRRLYHPLAWRLAERLQRTPVTPNMVSIAGGLLVIGAAVAYAQPIWPYSALVGLAFHMSWHIVDGADGDLARLTGRASPSGEIIDGLCDYLSHIALYLTLGAILQTQIGPWGWALVVGAGLSRIVQANYYEVQRRQYQWWVHGISWLRANEVGSRPRSPVLAWLGALYLRLASRLSPPASRIEDAVADRRTGSARSVPVRTLLRGRYGRSVARLAPLSANYRTLILGLSMLAGSPVYYFAIEAVILNLFLLQAIRSCNAAVVHVEESIAQLDLKTSR